MGTYYGISLETVFADIKAALNNCEGGQWIFSVTAVTEAGFFFWEFGDGYFGFGYFCVGVGIGIDVGV